MGRRQSELSTVSWVPLAMACLAVVFAVLHSSRMGSGGSHHHAAEVASEGAAVMEEPVQLEDLLAGGPKKAE